MSLDKTSPVSYKEEALQHILTSLRLLQGYFEKRSSDETAAAMRVVITSIELAEDALKS